MSPSQAGTLKQSRGVRGGGWRLFLWILAPTSERTAALFNSENMSLLIGIDRYEL